MESQYILISLITSDSNASNDVDVVTLSVIFTIDSEIEDYVAFTNGE